LGSVRATIYPQGGSVQQCLHGRAVAATRCIHQRRFPIYVRGVNVGALVEQIADDGCLALERCAREDWLLKWRHVPRVWISPLRKNGLQRGHVTTLGHIDYCVG
jgi:hypothetical protein